MSAAESASEASSLEQASERTSAQMSEWPSTYVSILFCSRPQCGGFCLLFRPSFETKQDDWEVFGKTFWEDVYTSCVGNGKGISKLMIPLFFKGYATLFSPAIWSRISKNPEWTTHSSVAVSLALLTRTLAPPGSLHMHTPLRSLVCSLVYFARSLA